MSQNMPVLPSTPLIYVETMEQTEENEAQTATEIDKILAKIRETTYQNSGVPT